MWHVETDFFALAVFLIMFIKEFGMRGCAGKDGKMGMRRVTCKVRRFTLYWCLAS